MWQQHGVSHGFLFYPRVLKGKYKDVVLCIIMCNIESCHRGVLSPHKNEYVQEFVKRMHAEI